MLIVVRSCFVLRISPKASAITEIMSRSKSLLSSRIRGKRATWEKSWTIILKF